jgi:hypothetical protein
MDFVCSFTGSAYSSTGPLLLRIYSLHKVYPLLCRRYQHRHHRVQCLLLRNRQRPIVQHLLHTVGPQAHRCGEKGGSGKVVLHEGALHDALLSAQRGQHSAHEDVRREGLRGGKNAR